VSRPLHPAIRDLMDCLDQLSNAAPDFDLEDAGTLSALEVRLAEIINQAVKIEAMRREDGFR
jgi:hypothetical protein